MDAWMRAETVIMKKEVEINGWMDGGCEERKKKGHGWWEKGKLYCICTPIGLMAIDVRLYTSKMAINYYFNVVCT
jgi:hypothetical protein